MPTSPFGSNTCTAEQITTAYVRGGSNDQSQACTLTFSRSSSGAGHLVELDTQWSATWSGVRADGSTIGPVADLADKTTESAVNVPVIEAHALNR
jgi:hypothetical protein